MKLLSREGFCFFFKTFMLLKGISKAAVEKSAGSVQGVSRKAMCPGKGPQEQVVQTQTRGMPSLMEGGQLSRRGLQAWSPKHSLNWETGAQASAVSVCAPRAYNCLGHLAAVPSKPR